MRRLLVLALLGCASAPASNPPPPDRVILVDDRGRVYRTANDANEGVTQDVPGPRDDVLRAVVGVYQDLGLDVNTLDPAAGLVGARNLNVPRRLGGQPISKYLNCGSDPMGGPTADSYLVTINAQSVATPASQGGKSDDVLVRTTVPATARRPGVSADPVHCTSNGALEKRINLLVAERRAR